MSKKEKVAQYRSMELLDCILNVIISEDIGLLEDTDIVRKIDCILNVIISEDIGLLEDTDIVRKMYVSCHALLNAPEKPWQEYEIAMKKFRKHLVKYIAHINQLKADNS